MPTASNTATAWARCSGVASTCVCRSTSKWWLRQASATALTEGAVAAGCGSVEAGEPVCNAAGACVAQLATSATKTAREARPPSSISSSALLFRRSDLFCRFRGRALGRLLVRCPRCERRPSFDRRRHGRRKRKDRAPRNALASELQGNHGLVGRVRSREGNDLGVDQACSAQRIEDIRLRNRLAPFGTNHPKRAGFRHPGPQYGDLSKGLASLHAEEDDR